MIKKLSKRICWIITIALSIIVVGIILLFTILNYRNTINTATIMMDRFTNRDIKKNVDGNKEIEVDKPTIEGVYYVQIEDSHVISNPNIVKDKTIEEYALKVSKKHNESGIIGNYIYKVRRIKENQINVMLIENEEAISHTQKIIITAIIISGVSLIIIYIIAKKISKFIVQPVEETFEKQKQFISDASHELKTPLAVIEANADVLEGENETPGKIVNITKDQIWISTGEGILAVNELQLEGKKRMNTEDFLRGYKMENAVLGMEE